MLQFDALMPRAELSSYLTELDLPPFSRQTLEEFLVDPNVSREQLLQYLKLARAVLHNNPGPHQEVRRRSLKDWIDYWINLLESSPQTNYFDSLRPNIPHICPFEQVAQHVATIRSLRPDLLVGVLNAAGFEGHPGHRFALDHMVTTAGVFPILLFEPDYNFTMLNKQRPRPLLDLKARMAMWSTYQSCGLMSVTPDYPVVLNSVDLTSFYQEIFDKTGADVSFAYDQDPFLEQKITRGRFHLGQIIPYHDTTSTTMRVEKLFPDLELDNDAPDVSELWRRTIQYGWFFDPHQ